MSINPFPIVQKALKELIETRYEPAQDKVGGDLSYTRDQDLYVWIGLIRGSTTEIDGEWSVDVDVFGTDWNATMGHALALEAILLERRHVTSVMRLDRTHQNESPADRPWDDDEVYRIGATYTFTARRTDG